MPYYEYKCTDCGKISEVKRGMNDPAYDVVCAGCGSSNVGRLYSAPHVLVRGGGSKRTTVSVPRSEMEAELRDDYGVNAVTPCNRYGKGYAETYRDIKERGSMVREMMVAREEETDRNQRKKNKAWMKDALARTTKRGREKKALRAKENAEKRRIVMQSPPKSGS